MDKLLNLAVERDELRPIDLHRALLCERLAGGGQVAVRRAAAYVSKAAGDGHSCLPLEALLNISINDQPLFENSTCEDLREALVKTAVVGGPHANMPLILDGGNRLYLHRYFSCENRIAMDIRGRNRFISDVNTEQARKLLQLLFPEAQTEPTEQHIACAAAIIRQILIISGGPGTGKTYIVARILALLQMLAKEKRKLRIALCAPTGKAAARLQESMQKAKKGLDAYCSDAVPEQASTIHRLLGVMPSGSGFRHNKNHPLPLDLLVLDEASMVDIELMAALLEALPKEARLILLGDRDQLASVEAGSLFGDLCRDAGPGWSQQMAAALQTLLGKIAQYPPRQSALDDCICFLSKSYRFTAKSGIARLAAAVKAGEKELLEEICDNPSCDIIFHFDQPDRKWFASLIQEQFGQIHHTTDDAYNCLNRFRILCALREGAAGVKKINAAIEEHLNCRSTIDSSATWYKGQPIMITRNNYDLNLYNGDMGMIWPTENTSMAAWFRGENGGLHPVSLFRLPEHETAYAITVHKAQGSEFDTVLLLLPEQDSPILSRELIYTALTRARKKLIIAGSRDVFFQSVSQKVHRYSGLAAQLQETL